MGFFEQIHLCLLGKNEVTLEFHQHDDAEIALMEMRFYVPPNNDGTDADPVKVICDITLMCY